MFRRCELRVGKKRGPGVGKTKRGKGVTIGAILASHYPERLIGGKAYDSDEHERRVAEKYDTELIAPHRRNRKKAKTQDGRVLRRYKRRWKVERLFAWLQNVRRIVTRRERKLENYEGFVQLGMAKIRLRQF